MALPENLLIPQKRELFYEFQIDDLRIFLQKFIFKNVPKISFKIPQSGRYVLELVEDDLIRI